VVYGGLVLHGTGCSSGFVNQSLDISNQRLSVLGELGPHIFMDETPNSPYRAASQQDRLSNSFKFVSAATVLH
jgi:hypothetical protein